MSASKDEINPQIPEASLHILSRDGVVVERRLDSQETTIGKAPQNRVILADPSVSGSHAVIRYSGGAFVIQDVGSRNGTFVNDAKVVEPRRLQHGDLIRMGHSTITFRVKQEAGAPARERTQILDPTQPPPPPAAPPAPKTAEVTEANLALALAGAGLVSQAVIDRLRGQDARGRSLARALIVEKLVSETALRDLMSRTFGIPLLEMKSAEIDTAVANQLSPAFLRDKAIFPLVGQGADRLMVAVSDPTDRAALGEVEKATGRKISLRLAAASEIVAQLDAFFTPRLIGVMSTGEKIEQILNQAEIEIGKATHNKLVISDPTVSSTHAVVLVRDGGYSIVDLGSSNGTFINGRRLGSEPHTLQHGDKIQFGQVLLTFRNPAETTENKTARLSLEALEEIRRRTAARDSGIRSKDQAASIPTLETDPGPEKKEKKKDKDKEEKKKKKEDDRIKAALVNSTSRILSTVLGTALTVFVAYYLTRPSGPSAPTGGGSGNPPEVKSKGHVSFSASYNWQNFGSGLFSRESIEASGAAFAPGSSGVLVVDDSRTNEVLWMQLDAEGKQAAPLKPVPLGVNFKDPEAITYGNSFYYIVTSQADPKSGAENCIVRFDFNPETKALRAPAEMITDLRAFLLANVSEIASLGAAPGMQGGLNIEGLAWDPNNERLLLGLRSPLIGNQAVLIPLKLKDPRGPFRLDNLKVDDPHVIVLPLEGHGVRDIAYDPRNKLFLIISGAIETSPRTDFGFWEWGGQSDAKPAKISVLEEKRKPEGICAVTIGGRSYIFVTGDSGSYTKIDYSDK